MQRNNPINSVYVIALAVASLILCVDSLIEAAIFSVVIVAAFLIGISVVSMIEKVADKHVRFLIFAIISSAVITVLKVVSTYISIEIIVTTSEIIEFAMVPCLLLAIIPIYFEEKYSIKEFFAMSIVSCFGLVLMLALYATIVEVAGYGMIAGFSLGFEGLEFFRMPYCSFMLIGGFAILFNIVRRTYLKKTRRFRQLVEQYKIEIKEIKSTQQRKEAANKGGEK